MSAELKVLRTVVDEKAEAGRERLLAFLDDLRVQAAEGKLKGLLLVTEDVDGYAYTRMNVGFQDAIALHTRAAYKLNQDWDAS